MLNKTKIEILSLKPLVDEEKIIIQADSLRTCTLQTSSSTNKRNTVNNLFLLQLILFVQVAYSNQSKESKNIQ